MIEIVNFVILSRQYLCKSRPFFFIFKLHRLEMVGDELITQFSTILVMIKNVNYLRRIRVIFKSFRPFTGSQLLSHILRAYQLSRLVVRYVSRLCLCV